MEKEFSTSPKGSLYQELGFDFTTSICVLDIDNDMTEERV